MRTKEVLSLAEAREAAASGRARVLREAARLTQEEVAAVCQVSAAAVSRWEAGQRVPRGQAGQRYAALLGALQERAS